MGAEGIMVRGIIGSVKVECDGVAVGLCFFRTRGVTSTSMSAWSCRSAVPGRSAALTSLHRLGLGISVVGVVARNRCLGVSSAMIGCLCLGLSVVVGAGVVVGGGVLGLSIAAGGGAEVETDLILTPPDHVLVSRPKS